MSEKQLVAFTLDENTKFLVEVDRQPIESDQPLTVSRVNGVDVATVTKKFDDVLNEIKPVINTVVSKLKDVTPDETEIKFGIKLTANAGVVFSSVGSEVTFEITVKWNQGKENKTTS